MSSKKYTRQIFVWLHDIMIDHANVPPVTGLAVAFCMANEYFNDDGRPCFASCETIGKKIGASKPTVIATVRKLAAAGYLKVEWGKPGRGHSNRYWPILKGTSEHLLDTGKGKPGNLLDTGKGKFQKNKRSISDAEKVSHETRTTKENHYKRTRVESRARARETTHPGFQPINGKANGGEAAPHPQPIAADWQPSADDAAYASHKGLTQADIERAIERFRHYWADKGAKRVAWSGAWRDWVQGDVEHKRERDGHQRDGNGAAHEQPDPEYEARTAEFWRKHKEVAAKLKADAAAMKASK